MHPWAGSLSNTRVASKNWTSAAPALNLPRPSPRTCFHTFLERRRVVQRNGRFLVAERPLRVVLIRLQKWNVARVSFREHVVHEHRRVSPGRGNVGVQFSRRAPVERGRYLDERVVRRVRWQVAEPAESLDVPG